MEKTWGFRSDCKLQTIHLCAMDAQQLTEPSIQLTGLCGALGMGNLGTDGRAIVEDLVQL